MSCVALLTFLVALSFPNAALKAAQAVEEEPGAKVFTVVVLVATVCSQAFFEVILSLFKTLRHRILLHATLIRCGVYLANERAGELERLIAPQRVAQQVPNKPNEATYEAEEDVKRLDGPSCLEVRSVLKQEL